MIIDAFIFFNELDILDIRLHEMDSFVDYFVLVESTKTFSNKFNAPVYESNKQRFKEFHHKIIHVIVEDAPDTTDHWSIEEFIRNATLRGVNSVPNISDNDWIILSDVDEILKSDTFNSTPFHYGNVYKFDTSMRYYKFNCRQIGGGWAAPVMVEKKFYTDPNNTRHNNNPIVPWDKCVYIKDGGWHLSFMGGIDNIINKLSSFAHQELNTDYYRERSRLQSMIKLGKDLFDRDGFFWEFINDTDYPEYVLRNMDKFKDYFQEMKRYEFICSMPFSGDYSKLSWAIESCYSEVSKYSLFEVPIQVFNNSKKEFDWKRIDPKLHGYFQLIDPYEPYMLPQVLNYGIKQASKLNFDFMMWMHDDSAMKANGMKLLIDKYEEIKDRKWGCIYLAKDGDVCSLYNHHFNVNENVFYEPLLFPLYFMDCHYTKIMRLRGYPIEYANWDDKMDFIVHDGSNTIKSNERTRAINDIQQEFWRGLYVKIWGGNPGEETSSDITAKGLA